MKQRQIIWLGGVLAFLILIALLTGVFGTDFSTVDVPELAVPAEEVTGIEASAPEWSVDLAREDGVWRLTAPIEAPADSAAVVRLLDDIGDFELRNVVSTNPERYARYGVDSAATRLTLNLNGESRTLLVGESGGSSSYVRIGDDEAVYQTDRRLRVPNTVDDWRDKRIVDVSPDQIARLSIVGPNRFVVLERGDGSWSMMDAGEPMEADSARVRRYLDRFNPLSADGFFETAPAESDSSFTVRIETGEGAERRIELSPSGDDIAARVDGGEAVFRIRGYRMSQVVPEASQFAP